MADRPAVPVPSELVARRREALELLRAHLLADRLDVDGYERWTRAILETGTVEDLHVLTRTLRPLPPVAPRTDERRRPRRWGVVAAVVVGVAAIAAVRTMTDDQAPARETTSESSAAPQLAPGPHAPRRQHLADVIERVGTLDACPDADALIEQSGDERVDDRALPDRLADYTPPTLLSGQLAVVSESLEDDYQTGRSWLDAALSPFVPLDGLAAEYETTDRNGPWVSILAFELDDVAQATRLRDNALRAFVCAPDVEPWSPTSDLVGGRSDAFMGEAILVRVDGERLVFFVAGAGSQGVATRDEAALRSAQEVLG